MVPRATFAMKKQLPIILSLGALSLGACKRAPEKAPEPAPKAEAPAAQEKPAPKVEKSPILSTDVPTPKEVLGSDPRVIKVEARLKKIIVDQLGVTADKVVLTADLFKDLGADSLDAVELVMACEEEFNLSIRDEDAAKIRTVGDTLKTLIELGAR